MIRSPWSALRRSRFIAGIPLIWPLLLASAVLIRQAEPFRVRSDDHAYYRLAKTTVSAAAEATETGGLLAGFAAFRDGCSVKGELPAHVHVKRPVLLWIWSGAYLIAGDQGLVWTWRFFYLFLILSLFFMMRYLSTPLIASVLTGVIAVVPATQGLLSWMACATYLVGYPFLLFGSLILAGKRGPVCTAVGLVLLIVSLLSREVSFLLVSGAVSILLWQAGRKYIPVILPMLAVLVWFIMPSEGRSALGTFQEDPLLFMRGGSLVAVAEASSIIRNLGLFMLIPLAVVLFRGRVRAGFIIGLGALFFVPVQWVLPALIAVLSTRNSGRSLFGLVWMLLVIGAMCLYGHFSSRYAFEPLVGFALALAPALTRIPLRRMYWVTPAVLWLTMTSLAPDMVFDSAFMRSVSNLFDQRIRALHTVTSLRHREYCTFAGRTGGEWEHAADLHVSSRRDARLRGFVWTSDNYMRAGSAPNLHCAVMDHVVFDRKRIWEWNVWYWRILPGRKGRGVHVNIPGKAWSVHPEGDIGDHDRCMFITPDSGWVTDKKRIQAERIWLADTPEINNPGRARRWLRTIWKNEKGCHADLKSRSFFVLELGRLLIRDDGWLDLLELNYLMNLDS